MATTPVIFLKETRDEVIRLTSVVIIVSLIVGIFLGGIDYILTNLLTLIIK